MKAYQAVHSVSMMCRVLEVSRSGYYAWLTREPSLRSLLDEELLVEIHRSYWASRGIYGAPRIQADVQRVRDRALVETDRDANAAADTLVIADDGRQLVAVGGGSIASHPISAADGTLSPQSFGTPSSLSGATRNIALDPDGLTVYAAYESNDTIGAIALQSPGAGPTLGAPISSGSGSTPNGVAVSADGSRIYVSLWASSAIAILSTSATADLTVDVAARSISLLEPAASRVTSDGRFLIVVGQMGNAVAVLSIAASTGSLTDVSGSPFATGVVNAYPDGVAVTP